MSTNSTIAVLNPNGTVSQIYCHYDGYVSYNGQMLVDHYNNQELAEKLVFFGNLSSLFENIEPDLESEQIHNFSLPQKNVNVYYDRDRGEDDQGPEIFRSLELFKSDMANQGYNYFWDGNEWLVIEEDSKEWQKVSSLLK